MHDFNFAEIKSTIRGLINREGEKIDLPAFNLNEIIIPSLPEKQSSDSRKVINQY